MRDANEKRAVISYHITFIPINDTTIPIHDSKLTAKSDFLPEHTNAPIPDIKKSKYKLPLKFDLKLPNFEKLITQYL